jgi:hypothetical protein
MNTPIRLKRAISVQGWHVTGTIAFATKREWEPALLKLAVQHGSLTAEVVVSELLGGRSGVARRLLDICTRLGLLEVQRQAWVPTQAGRAAAQTGLVLVPERGTWTLWAAEDPLLPSPIVAAAPWKEPSAYDERTRDARRSIQELPHWLIAAIGTVVEPLGGKHRALRIDDLGKEARGEPADARASLGLALTITPAGARVRFTAKIDGDALDADVPAPSLSHDHAWASLLRQAGLAKQWDARRSALLTAFTEASEAERSSLVRTVCFTRPELVGLGRFDDTTVESVPLCPSSQSDAATWAKWRLVQGVKTYLLDGGLQAAYRDAAAPFGDMAPGCPPRVELASHARGDARPPPQFWRLQAPTDWSLDGRRPQ